VGIYSSSGARLEELQHNGLSFEQAREEFRKEQQINPRAVGIPLKSKYIFCLVPTNEIKEIISFIDSMNLEENDKKFLKQQIIPYDSENDHLAEKIITDLKENPEKYWGMVDRQSDIATSSLEKATSVNVLESINYQKVIKDGKILGVRSRKVPTFRSYANPEMLSEEILLLQRKLNNFGLQNLVNSFPESFLPIFLTFLRYLIINMQNANNLNEEEIINEIRIFSLSFIKKIDDLEPHEKDLLLKSGIVLGKEDTSITLLDSLKKQYIPLASNKRI
jgi:hypothetical protein